MNTEQRYCIEVSGIQVEIVRKAIKNLHLGVYPPEGRVRIAAPQTVSDEAVRLAVVSKLPWIKRQRARFAEQARQSRREMISGESHYFLGRRYRLDVRESSGRPKVRLRGSKTIEMFVPYGSSRDVRERVLQLWYRRELKARIPSLLVKWEPKVGKRASEVRIRRMKTRWGSCNPDAGRIWLNLELIKKPEACLEYVLVHELIHLHERRHNERFYELLERAMPTWRLQREKLNRAPLAEETWKY